MSKLCGQYHSTEGCARGRGCPYFHLKTKHFEEMRFEGWDDGWGRKFYGKVCTNSIFSVCNKKHRYPMIHTWMDIRYRKKDVSECDEKYELKKTIDFLNSEIMYQKTIINDQKTIINDQNSTIERASRDTEVDRDEIMRTRGMDQTMGLIMAENTQLKETVAHLAKTCSDNSEIITSFLKSAETRAKKKQRIEAAHND